MQRNDYSSVSEEFVNFILPLDEAEPVSSGQRIIGACRFGSVAMWIVAAACQEPPCTS